MKYLLASLLGLLFLGIPQLSTAQVDTHYVLDIGAGVGPSGVGIAVPVTLNIVADAAGTPPVPVQGWSYGVCHDPSMTSVSAAVDGSTTLTVKGGAPPDFNQVMVTANGFTVAVIIDFFGTFTLPAGTNYELNVATYQLSGPIGTTTPLVFCNTLGSPPVLTAVVATMNPNSITPVQLSGSVTIANGGVFDRGDCDDSGSYNLSDMVYLLGYLFPLVGNPPNAVNCFDACDATDDGSVNLQDVVVGLNTLFVPPTVPLPAPYTVCGGDPTADNLDCVTFTSCP